MLVIIYFLYIANMTTVLNTAQGSHGKPSWKAYLSFMEPCQIQSHCTAQADGGKLNECKKEGHAKAVVYTSKEGAIGVLQLLTEEQHAHKVRHLACPLMKTSFSFHIRRGPIELVFIMVIWVQWNP